MTHDANGMPPSHRLFTAIINRVAEAKHNPLTIREIAERLDVTPDVVSACIALHSPLACGIIDPDQVELHRPEEIVDEITLGIAARHAVP